MENYGIKRCFYGHIHGVTGGLFDLADDITPHFVSGGVSYRLISADYIDFSPVRIL